MFTFTDMVFVLWPLLMAAAVILLWRRLESRVALFVTAIFLSSVSLGLLAIFSAPLPRHAAPQQRTGSPKPQADTAKLKDFNFTVPSHSNQKRGTKPECIFDGLSVPEHAVVYAAGAYSGRKAGFQIDQSGSTATQFDIAVNSKSRPVILMLGAYAPTIWNLGWTDTTRILAVIASGYHRQVVAGLPDDVPLLISSYHDGGPCGYFYIRKGNNTRLNRKARMLFGKPVELVYVGDESGKIVIGDPLSRSERLLTSSTTPPESFKDVNAPLAGMAGLDAAVSKGLIRPATAADADRWVQEVAAQSSKQDVPPIAGVGLPRPRHPTLFNAYVVLHEFTYPSGLYGAHAATFFIEHGAPRPSGNPGHSAVYDFNTLGCRGTLCRR